MYEILILALACLIAPVFGKYAGYELHKKPFDLVAAAGLFFLLAVAFHSVPGRPEWMGLISRWGALVSHLLGWLGLVVGAFWAALNVLMEREAKLREARQ